MGKQAYKVGLVLLIMILCTGSLLANPIQGELNGSLVYEWDNDGVEHTGTFTGFRFVLEDYVDPYGKLHFSTKGNWNWKAKEGKLAVDELWFSGYAGDVDYTLGRQTISWGTADGFNPTNYFARLSSDALVSGDLGGEPIWAGQATYYGPSWSVSGVVIPFFKAQEIDEQMESLMAEQMDGFAFPGIDVLDTIRGTKKPRGLGKNSEIALRAETQIANFDVQASFFSGFESLPALELVMTVDAATGGLAGVNLEGQYRRQNFLGLATSGTLGSAGIWGEISYGGAEALKESENPLEIRTPLSVNEKYLQLVLGGDYTFDVGKGLLAQAQYVYRGQGSLFAPYIKPDLANLPLIKPGKIEAAHYLYGRLGYDFTVDSSVDLVILHDVKDKSGLIRPAYTHRFPNSIQLEVSVIGVYGGGDLGSLPQQMRLALKYQF